MDKRANVDKIQKLMIWVLKFFSVIKKNIDRNNFKKKHIFLINLVVSVSLLVFILMKVPMRQFSETFSSNNLPNIILGLLFYLAERFIRSFRLYLFMGYGIKITTVISSQAITQAINLVIPFKAGEAILIKLLKDLANISYMEMIITLIYDRLYDLMVVICVVIIVLIQPEAGNLHINKLFYSLLLMVAFALTLLLSKKIRGWIFSYIKRSIMLISSRNWAYFANLLTCIQDSNHLFRLRDKQLILRGLTCSITVWILAGTGSLLLAKCTWPSATYQASILFVTLSSLGVAFISIPSGIGIIHAIIYFVATGYGASPDQAAQSSVLIHTIMTCSTVIFALPFLFKYVNNLFLR